MPKRPEDAVKDAVNNLVMSAPAVSFGTTIADLGGKMLDAGKAAVDAVRPYLPDVGLKGPAPTDINLPADPSHRRGTYLHPKKR